LYGWKLALQTWWAHPLIGAGTGNFESLSADYDFVRGAQSQGSSPHQTYFFLLANYGLIGAFSVMTIMVATIRRNVWLARTSQANMLLGLALAFALSVNMIGWFADDSGFFGPHAGYLLWLFIGLSEVTAKGMEPALAIQL
jgi:O-antigen ligase